MNLDKAKAAAKGGGSIGHSLLGNVSVVLIGRFAEFALQFLSAVVLARLLTPEDFGLFAVASGVTAVLYAFRDFGVTNYLIRIEFLSPPIVGSVFLISAGMSVGLGSALALSADWLAAFFGDLRLTWIIWLLVANFYLYPFSMLSLTLLQRQERFADLVLIGLVAGIVGAAATMLLALFGAGALSLVIGITVSNLVRLALGILAKPEGLSYRFSLAHVGEVMRFGGWLTGVAMATQFAERSTELIIGRTHGLSSAGLFDKGSALVRLFHQSSASIVQVVVFSAMARELRDGDDIGPVFFDRLTILTGLLWPLFIVIAFNAQPLLLLLFGAQWVSIASATSFLAIGALVVTPFVLGDQVLIVRNKVRQLFFAKGLFFLSKVFVLIVFSPFGLTAIAAALLIPSFLYLLLQLRLVLPEVGGSGRLLWISLRSSVILAASVTLSGIVTIYLFGYNTEDQLLLRLAFAGCASALAWLIASVVVRGPTAEIRQRLVLMALESIRNAPKAYTNWRRSA